MSGTLRGITINGQTTTTEGTVWDVSGRSINYSMYITSTSTSDGGVIGLEGSEDGTNWVSLTSTTITTDTTTLLSSINKPARYLRGNMTTYTDGTYVATIIALGK